MSNENCNLIAEFKQLEEEDAKRKDEFVAFEEMKEENDMLHQSTEEAMQLARGMNKKMESFVEIHQ